MPNAMITPLSVATIRGIEREGLAHQLPLMQRAGAAAATFIMNRFPPTASVLSLVGPGNNGGDALVASTRLRECGYNVQVVMPANDLTLSAEAATALEQWRDTEGTEATYLPATKPDVVIDGLFGIGLNRPLEPPWQDLIDKINDWNVSVLALDIPSGLSADTGEALGRPIRATWTLAFISPTHALNDAISKGYAGKVEVEPLGLPYQAPENDEKTE